MDPDKIRPPFNAQDEQQIRDILEEAQINPDDFFEIPQQPDPNQPGRFTNPNVPKARIKENFNGQKGNGTFTDIFFNEWQPGCGQPFYIVISEVWTPPPANLAAKFKDWAAFATLRAILICRHNRDCPRPLPLGCDSAWDIRFPNGTHYARASFVFECIAS